MVEQSKVGNARRAVNGALVLEYEDMLTGKSSKLSRSQCLRLGRVEVPKVRRLPDGTVPQIIRLVVSKENASFPLVVHRYVCLEPVPAAMLW